jgi:hypothetical protein
VQARLEDDAQCLLVIIGATPEGKKDSSALSTAYARVRHPGRSCCSTYGAYAQKKLIDDLRKEINDYFDTL